MSLLLICVLTLSVFWKGDCQRGDEQFPQFHITGLDTTTANGRLPDSSDSLIFIIQTEDTSGGTPPSITKVISREDSGTSTPPTITAPSRTPSLERVTTPTAATDIGTTLTPVVSHANAMLSTATTNTTTIFSTTVTNRNGNMTTAATSTTTVLTTAVTYVNATPTTMAANMTNPALTLAAGEINTHKDNNEETKNNKEPTTQMPSITSAGTRPTEHVIDWDDWDYYYNEEEEAEARSKGRGDMPKCKHDPCEHLQWPCLEVSQGNCMCPGLTPDSVTPSPPLTMDAQDVTASSAEVRWCAPYSSVSGYELRVREEASGSLTSHDVDPTFRRFRLSGLRESRAYTVCLTAKNRAGSSHPVCAALTTSMNAAVVTYALAAAVAAITVLALVLTVCLCRQCRKPPLENQRNTSLISIPNPAYYHPQETTDILKV